MHRRTKIILALAGVVAALAVWYAYHQIHSLPQNSVADLTALLPAQSETILYVDAAALRSSPFFARLVALAPKPQADADYAQFLQVTGFDYERDLSQAAVALWHSGQETEFFAVINGRFDRAKIVAYALRTGSRSTHGGADTYSVQVSGSARRVSFAFLSPDRIALSNQSDVSSFLQAPQRNANHDIIERALRLAGSPLFVILQPKFLAGAAPTAPAPGGIRLDQLQSLAASLRWLTIAARPQGDCLQLIAEGECPSDDDARQLESALNGLLLIARASADDPKTQRHMEPATRDALIETLKNADVSRIDRGDTKSVRLVIELSARLLEAAQQNSNAQIPSPAH